MRAAAGFAPLKYQPVPATKRERGGTRDGAGTRELLTLKLRYKAPDADESRLLEFPFVDNGSRFDTASHDLKLSCALAGFGMLLRESPHKGTTTWSDVVAWAAQGVGPDADGRRKEFLDLARLAQKIAEE